MTDKKSLETLINKTFERYADKLIEYKNGKTDLFGFFLGEMIRLTKGKANPVLIEEILKEKLKY